MLRMGSVILIVRYVVTDSRISGAAAILAAPFAAVVPGESSSSALTRSAISNGLSRYPVLSSERAVSFSASSPNPVITSTGRSGCWILMTLRILSPSISGMKMSVTR